MMSGTARRTGFQRFWAILCLAVLAVATGLTLLPSARAGELAAIAPFSAASDGIAPGAWRFTSLPNKVPTRFDIVREGGQRVLRVEADKSYGNLVHPTHMPLNESTTLAWRWRVDEFVQNTDLRSRAGDDGAAKLCVFFNFPIAQLPIAERTRLTVARAATGEDVPSEALCYVWDGKEAKGSMVVNAFTRRMRMIVLESGPSPSPGAWLAERRNLLADYRSAFGDEAGSAMPDVVAVAISADADNTQGHGLAYFSDVDLRNATPVAMAPAPAAKLAGHGD